MTNKTSYNFPIFWCLLKPGQQKLGTELQDSMTKQLQSILLVITVRKDLALLLWMIQTKNQLPEVCTSVPEIE